MMLYRAMASALAPHFCLRKATGTGHLLAGVVKDTLEVPNSTAFSPDAGLDYISGTGSVSTNLLQQYPGYQDFNITNHHTVCVFDVAEKVAGKPYLTNRRSIFQSNDWTHLMG